MIPELGVMFRRDQHPATLADFARRVEAMGFDQLWVVEDCFFLGGIAQTALALAATTRVKVGIGINPAVARNPAFLAMEYATLASTFPGRLIGGIGHGFGPWMEQVGAKPASWLRSIEEIAIAVQRILRGDDVTMHGDYVNLHDVRLFSPPEIVPPILLGVQAERSVRLAGRCADGLLLAEGAGPDYVRWARDLMAQGRADTGRDGQGQVVVYAHCLVDDADPDAARESMRRKIARGVGPDLQPQLARASFAPELAALATGGKEAVRAGMPDAWLNDLAITGSSEDGLNAIGRLGDAGTDAVVLVPPEGVDPEAWLATPAVQRLVDGRDRQRSTGPA
ncbi:MAG: LLM class flavin-dependent oxidoreductase [Thermomicrobiales bacterium]